MKGAHAKQTLQKERQTRKMQDKDMVEVCRYEVCWLGKKGKKIPYVDGMKFSFMRSLFTPLQKGMNKMPNIQSLVSEIGLGQSGGIARINCI